MMQLLWFHYICLLMLTEVQIYLLKFCLETFRTYNLIRLFGNIQNLLCIQNYPSPFPHHPMPYFYADFTSNNKYIASSLLNKTIEYMRDSKRHFHGDPFIALHLHTKIV